MEQVLATINYFIREKLWCSIRKLCDLVSPSCTLNSLHIPNINTSKSN